MSQSPATSSIKELTIRGIIIGGIITVVFTAANVYLGLKVGITFATSIPAAVISMAILRRFADHTVQENNIVQTIASAAGTLSSIIFVLPGLIIIGWWSGFPYWTTVFIIILGGILGSPIPFRCGGPWSPIPTCRIPREWRGPRCFASATPPRGPRSPSRDSG